MPGRDIRDLRLAVSRREVVACLSGVVALLVVLSLAGQYSKFHLGYPNLLGLVPLFYVDLENNIPTWYQTLALAFAAVLLLLLGSAARTAKAPLARHWFALSLLFVFLSLDEAASMHEATMEPMSRVTGSLEGVWQSLWVIPGLLAVVAVAAAFLPFVLRFGWKDRLRIFAAGALFVGGAVGMEMATAAMYETSDPIYKESFTYALMAHGEEALEMLGVVVFIDFLLRRLALTTMLSVSVSE